MTLKPEDVSIYRNGAVHCSVCVPDGASSEEIELAVNAVNPTGLSSGWKIDDAPNFASGETNPCPCEVTSGRSHYLMVC